MRPRSICRFKATESVLICAAGVLALVSLTDPRRSLAQSTTSAATERFEVASVKRADPSSPGAGVRLQPGGRFTTTASLRSLIEFAYDIRDFQISTEGPKWYESELYAIDARPTDAVALGPAGVNDASAKPIRLMVQSLLAERFKLAVHTESRVMPVYSLTVAKSGPKLKENLAGPGPELRGTAAGHVAGERLTIPLLARFLSLMLGRIVLDQTELTGNYDFTLEWRPESNEPRGPEAVPPADTDARPSIFTALQEQLGLKLESAKAPVETIVIDRAEKPEAN